MTSLKDRLKELTDDELDDALHLAVVYDAKERIDAIFKERSRRFKVRREEIAQAEAEWDAEIDALIEADKQRTSGVVRVRKLNGNQVYRLADTADLIEGLDEPRQWVEGKTYVEGSFELISALYDHISGDAAYDEGMGETEAQQAMAYRAALISREALSARLAAALGDKETASKHRWAIRRIRRMSVDRVMEQS